MVKKEVKEPKKSLKKKTFDAVLDKDSPKETKVNSKFKVDREGGWKDKKPHTKSERKKLLDICGKDAFLLPQHLKFPICNKINEKNSKCTYNCMGLKGCSSRAGEWGYHNVLKNSKKLTSELGCYTDPSKNVKSKNVKEDTKLKNQLKKKEKVKETVKKINGKKSKT